MHSSGSITRKFGPSWKQSTGHTSTQSVYLHLMQFSVTTKGIAIQTPAADANGADTKNPAGAGFFHPARGWRGPAAGGPACVALPTGLEPVFQPREGRVLDH